MDDLTDRLPATCVETLRLFHDEELLGEAYFLELLRTESEPLARLKLTHLAQVETGNTAWLRQQLLAAGVSVAVPQEALDAGRRLARDTFTGSWRDYMGRMRDRLTEVHIPRFRGYLDQAERRGDRVEIAACRLMVGHDCAFLTFAERDLAGAPIDHILEPLKARHWMPVDDEPSAPVLRAGP